MIHAYAFDGRSEASIRIMEEKAADPASIADGAATLPAIVGPHRARRACIVHLSG